MLIFGCFIQMSFRIEPVSSAECQVRRCTVSQFKVSWKGFSENEEGGIAILFALTMVPVLGIIGGAIDYGRAFA